MTIRGLILTAVHDRLRRAYPDAYLEVARKVSVQRPAVGSAILVLLPGDEVPWDEGSYEPRDFRDFAVVVQVARVSDPVAASLAVWLALEDLIPCVCEAVEGGGDEPDDLDGLLASAMDRMSVEPTDKEVGGIAVGVEVTWRMRYAVVGAQPGDGA